MSSLATPPQEHHHDQATCSHENATISFFTETAFTYHRHRGEVIEELESNEPELTDEVSVWCPDCHLDATYADYWAAPTSIRAICKKIRVEHWDEEEEDDGSFTVLLTQEGGPLA